MEIRRKNEYSTTPNSAAWFNDEKFSYSALSILTEINPKNKLIE